MGRALGIGLDAEHATPDGLPRVEELLDHGGERRHAEEHVADVAGPVGFGQSEQLAAEWIERLHAAIGADDEQAGGEARDDLVAQPLRGLGAGGEGALALLELRHGFFHGGRHERRFGAGVALDEPVGVLFEQM